MDIISNSFCFKWEVTLIEWIQAHMGSFGLTLASFFSIFGEIIITILVLGFLYWGIDKELGKRVGLTAILSIVFYPMLKNIFCRRRPYMDHNSISCLKAVEEDKDIYDLAAQGYSFPSGHATVTVADFSATAFFHKGHKWLNAVGIIIPLFCGISRFCLGVHYPTDVLCGWILGAAVIFLVDFLLKRIPDKRVLYAVLLVLTLPGIIWCRSTDYFSDLGILIGFLFGVAFEEKHVNFENTRNVLRCLLRVVGGGAIFFALNKLLELPFSSQFLDSGTLGALLVRTGRYAVDTFVIIGVYPFIFRRKMKEE